VSDWWCCRAGVFVSRRGGRGGAESAGSPPTLAISLYHTLEYGGGYSAHHGTRAGTPRGGGGGRAAPRGRAGGGGGGGGGGRPPTVHIRRGDPTTLPVVRCPINDQSINITIRHSQSIEVLRSHTRAKRGHLLAPPQGGPLSAQKTSGRLPPVLCIRKHRNSHIGYRVTPNQKSAGI